MSENTELIASALNHNLSLATIIGGVVVIIWFLVLLYEWNIKKETKILSFVNKYILPLGFFITLLATFLTLYYSEFLKIVPCDLCWYQRIFLYPQVILFGYAWMKKDLKVMSYSIILSIVGFVIAIYHHFLQMGYDIYKPCSTAPFAVSCAEPTFVEYGFVTFPFMAVVLFGFLILLSLNNCKRK